MKAHGMSTRANAESGYDLQARAGMAVMARALFVSTKSRFGDTLLPESLFGFLDTV
jgi:hypothetical protein